MEDLATLGTSLRVLAAVGHPGMTRIEQSRPKTSQIREAAAVLRPIMLDRDYVNHNNVMASIRHLTQSASATAKSNVEAVRTGWQRFPKSPYWSMAGIDQSTGVSMGYQNDRQIAEAWLYADLVHADPVRAHEIRLVPEEQRLVAATLWVKDAILLTRATQMLLIDLEDASEIPKRT
jgi:hypothetical protein